MINELKKLFLNRYLGCMALILCVLPFIQYVTAVSSEQYREYVQDIPVLSRDLEEGLLGSGTDLSVYLLKLHSTEPFIYPVIREKVTYKELLRKKERDLTQKLSSSLFQDPKDRKELQYELDEVQNSQKIQVKFYNDLLYLKYMASEYAYVLILLCAAVFSCYLLFVRDMETGMVQLYSVTRRGLAGICLDKLSALLLWTALLFALKDGGQMYCMIRASFPLQTPLQMVSGYAGFLGSASAASHLLLCDALNYMLVAITVGIFLAAARFTHRSAVSFMTAGAFYLAEYLMNALISPASSMAFLKKVNVFSVMNLCLRKEITRQSICRLGALLTACTALIIILIVLMYRQKKTPDHRFSVRLNSTWLSVYQGADILIRGKVLLIFICVLTYAAIDFSMYRPVKTRLELRKEEIREMYYGELTKDKVSRLEETKEQLDSYRGEMDLLVQDYIEGCLDHQQSERFELLAQKTADKEAFDAVYEEIMSVAQENGTHYVNSEGVTLWLQADSSWLRAVLFFLIAFPALLSAAVCGNAMYHSDISAIVFSSVRKEKYIRNTALYTICTGIVLTGIVYGMRWWKFIRYVHIPLTGIPVSWVFPHNSAIPLQVYVLLYFACMIAIIISFSLLTVYMTRRFPAVQSFLIILTAVLILYSMPSGIHVLLSPKQGYWQAFPAIIAVCIAFSTGIIHGMTQGNTGASE